MIPEQIGRYEVKSLIGQGGMATVFLAHDPRFRRDVAVKVLPEQLLANPIFRARFEREAQTIASLEHPAIVPVYDFGDEGGQPYLVMRYMPGGSLSDRLKDGPLSLSETVEILSRLAPALDAVHAHGIIHRDLKPANILFDQYGNSFLSDFGIARLTEATTNLTGEAIIGTPAYMSPEQVRGDEGLDGRSDIYALGAILFEMLTGQQPFQATTPMGVALKQITEPVPDIRSVKEDLPPEVTEVIERAMAKEPDLRYPTSSRMVETVQLIERNNDLPGVVLRPPTKAPDTKAEPKEEAKLAPVEVPQPAAPAPAQAAPAPAPSQPVQRKRGPLGIVFIIGAVAFIGLCIVMSVVFWRGSMFFGGPFITQAADPTLAAIIQGRIATAAGENQPAGTAAPEVAATITTPAEAVAPPAQGSAPAPESADLQEVSSLSSGDAPRTRRQVERFFDDFSALDSGWTVEDLTEAKLSYDFGNYRIWVDRPNIIAWGTPGLEFDDVSLEVQATKVSGADENFFGLICRHVNDDNFYLLGIASDGYYAITKMKDGEWQTIKEQYFLYHQDIHQGETTNRIRATCIDNRLTLWANDTRLMEVEDNDFASGDVGLAAVVFSAGETNLLFDNFLAERP